MSSKKDKLIEDAQRFALRGQLDKAIKAYEQVLSLDASAINQRQRLAELLVKAGRKDSARTEFETIGKFYSTNGYYLKAIAVYKKLQTMFPGDIAISLALAELNGKHGLAANALAEYKQVYDYYEQNAEHDEALKILELMHGVDQQNVGIKLKLAEAYFQAGMHDEAYALFGRLATLLQERGDATGLGKLTSRIQQLFPEKAEFMFEVLSEQVRGDSASTLNAVTGIQTLLRNNPRDKRIWELVVEAYQRLDQPDRVKLAYQHYLKFFPDEMSAQKGLIECLMAERDVNGSIQMLDECERTFVAESAVDVYLRLYQGLEQVDPINPHVLQGLKHALELCGDEEGAANVGRKINSLHSISGKQVESPVVSTSVPETSAQAELSGTAKEQPFSCVEIEIEQEELSKTATFTDTLVETEPVFSEQEEFEIEIELDGDDTSPFASLPVDSSADGGAADAWLESVETVFDSSASPSRSVKFGDDVDISDAQSHYDLGVAFKEMGLFDEAVNEFRQAAEDPQYRTPCLILQAACLRIKGSLDSAENLLRSYLKMDLNDEEVCSVKYELAQICQEMGNRDEVSALLAEIDAKLPGFRAAHSSGDDVGEETSLDFSDDDLDGFDLK